MIFDTHIHLNDDKLYNNLDEYLKNAEQVGVFKFLCVGWDIESSKKAIEIATKYKNVYAAVAIMPTEHEKYNENSIKELRELAKNNKVVAIGEIGLDYYWEKEEAVKEKQKRMFVDQIKLANELNLPICVHCREAIGDCLEIVKNFHVENKSIMHCFAGSLESAREFIKENFVIAFGGTLTYKNSKNTQEVFMNIPLDCIVFETDAPYLPPQEFRGKINLPEYIKKTILFASNQRNLNLEEMENMTYNNAINIFHVEKDE